MLENKDYCDYDTCVALRELGYPLDEFGDRRWDEYFAIVLLYEAQKWLREEKNIQIEIPISFMDNGVWKFGFRIQTPEFYDRAIGKWDSYEEALLEGIKQVVKILKDNRKQALESENTEYDYGHNVYHEEL